MRTPTMSEIKYPEYHTSNMIRVHATVLLLCQKNHVRTITLLLIFCSIFSMTILLIVIEN